MNQSTAKSRRKADASALSRRVLLGSSGAAVLGALSASTLGRESTGEMGRSGPPKEILERIEQSRPFSERMRNVASMEERAKIMEERGAWERKMKCKNIRETVKNALQPQRTSPNRRLTERA